MSEPSAPRSLIAHMAMAAHHLNNAQRERAFLDVLAIIDRFRSNEADCGCDACEQVAPRMTQTKLPQVWHPVDQWEEVAHNMWGKATDRNAYIQRAIQFTSNHEQYGHYMRRVCEEWPISTENAFTDPYLNHRAWVGGAACALAFGCPEDIVRQAWRYLTDEQKLLANKEADRAIAAWRRTYLKDRGIRRDVAAAMLPGFDS